MKVTKVSITPLAVPFKESYYYSQGVTQGANPILVEVETDEGLTGIGEGCSDRSAEATVGILKAAARLLEGEDPFEIERFFHRFYRHGKWDDMRRFANQAVAGVEMAWWAFTRSDSWRRVLSGRVDIEDRRSSIEDVGVGR